jgi:hypothetical protein
MAAKTEQLYGKAAQPEGRIFTRRALRRKEKERKNIWEKR